jgi:hypothetical protein
VQGEGNTKMIRKQGYRGFSLKKGNSGDFVGLRGFRGILRVSYKIAFAVKYIKNIIIIGVLISFRSVFKVNYQKICLDF